MARKDETHELVMRPEWHKWTAVPGITWCDLNHMLPDDVLENRQPVTKDHLQTVTKLLPTVWRERAVAALCPSYVAPRVAVEIETLVQDHILTYYNTCFFLVPCHLTFPRGR